MCVSTRARACARAHTHQMISGRHRPLYPPAMTIHMEEADIIRWKVLWGQRWTRSQIRLPAAFLPGTGTHEFPRHTECADLVGSTHPPASQGYSRAGTQEQTPREGCQRKSWGFVIASWGHSPSSLGLRSRAGTDYTSGIWDLDI